MTTQHWFRAQVREIDREGCVSLLKEHRVGRIAFIDASGPALLPVNYSLDGHDVLITTSAYGVLATSAPDSQVSFEVDDVDPAEETGWSVIVRGRAEKVESSQLPADPEARSRPWPEGVRSLTLRIRADSITGRRLIAV